MYVITSYKHPNIGCSSHFNQQIKNMPCYWSSNLIQDNQPYESLLKLSNVNNPAPYWVQHDQDNATPLLTFICCRSDLINFATYLTE